ncbi:hypothetical protein HD806DRAFT_538045 [Xylariaceae sp. AK1471]|nr:hypothetical protein HD806DRAFT_538045 [Xylariaceae sp. AK1471]
MSVFPSPPSSPSFPAPPQGHADRVADMADALSIPPSDTESRQEFAEFVFSLQAGSAFDDYFAEFFASYDWESHSRDAAEVLYDVAALALELPRRKLGDLARWPIQSVDESVYFACLVVLEKVLILIRSTGQLCQWCPDTTPHAQAFAYVILLSLFIQTGRAPAKVSEVYADALAHLKTFYCSNCGMAFNGEWHSPATCERSEVPGDC